MLHSTNQLMQLRPAFLLNVVAAFVLTLLAITLLTIVAMHVAPHAAGSLPLLHHSGGASMAMHPMGCGNALGACE